MKNLNGEGSQFLPIARALPICTIQEKQVDIGRQKMEKELRRTKSKKKVTNHISNSSDFFSGDNLNSADILFFGENPTLTSSN